MKRLNLAFTHLLMTLLLFSYLQGAFAIPENDKVVLDEVLAKVERG